MFHLFLRLSYLYVTICIVWILWFCSFTYAWPISWIQPKDTTNILTQSSDKVIDTSYIKWNPLIEWTDVVAGKTKYNWSTSSIKWITSIDNTKYSSVIWATTQKIQNVTNWALWFIALICLIYLIYQWVMLLIRFDDDKAQWEALSSIKTVAWVIWWIWLSWFIVSVAFYIVSKIAW